MKKLNIDEEYIGEINADFSWQSHIDDSEGQASSKSEAIDRFIDKLEDLGEGREVELTENPSLPSTSSLRQNLDIFDLDHVAVSSKEVVIHHGGRPTHYSIKVEGKDFLLKSDTGYVIERTQDFDDIMDILKPRLERAVQRGKTKKVVASDIKLMRGSNNTIHLVGDKIALRRLASQIHVEAQDIVLGEERDNKVYMRYGMPDVVIDEGLDDVADVVADFINRL